MPDTCFDTWHGLLCNVVDIPKCCTWRIVLQHDNSLTYHTRTMIHRCDLTLWHQSMTSLFLNDCLVTVDLFDTILWHMTYQWIMERYTMWYVTHLDVSATIHEDSHFVLILAHWCFDTIFCLTVWYIEVVTSFDTLTSFDTWKLLHTNIISKHVLPCSITRTLTTRCHEHHHRHRNDVSKIRSNRS